MHCKFAKRVLATVGTVWMVMISIALPVSAAVEREVAPATQVHSLNLSAARIASSGTKIFSAVVMDAETDYFSLMRKAAASGTTESMSLGILYEANRNAKIDQLGDESMTKTELFTSGKTAAKIEEILTRMFEEEQARVAKEKEEIEKAARQEAEASAAAKQTFQGAPVEQSPREETAETPSQQEATSENENEEEGSPEAATDSPSESSDGVWFTEEELEWVTRVTFLEAGCSWMPDWVPDTVVQVMVNRMHDPRWSNTLIGVLKDPSAYQPYLDGTMWDVDMSDPAVLRIKEIARNRLLAGNDIPSWVAGQSAWIWGEVYSQYYDPILGTTIYFTGVN